MKSVFFSFLFVLVTIGCKDSNSHNDESKIMTDSTATNDSILVATIKTNMGNIEVNLFEKLTPKTVENFVRLAKKNYYDGVIFHRVIDKFMIQGGDPTGTGRGGQSMWGKSFEDEIVPSLVFDKPGYLAMANAGPNTNGSQFFITVIPTPWLNGHHTIFGEVIGGMDVVYSISKVPTSKPGDRPLKDIIIENIVIEKRAPTDSSGD
jgi:cyclophilin family peptidyl-prolyl cis-trans isomerase